MVRSNGKPCKSCGQFFRFYQLLSGVCETCILKPESAELLKPSRESILELKQAGMTAIQIAKALSISRHAVYDNGF